MSWRVEWTKPSARDLKRLDHATQQRIYQAVHRLGETERGDIKPLKGRPHTYRLRVGDWRVIFEAAAGSDLIRVLRVHHRSQAYR